MEPKYNLNIEVYKQNIHGTSTPNGEMIFFSIGRRNREVISGEELGKLKETFDEVNRIIKEDVGQLYVPKTDLDILESGMPQKHGDEIVTLDELLNSRGMQRAIINGSAVSDEVVAKFLGYGHLIFSLTHTNRQVRNYEETLGALKYVEDGTFYDQLKESVKVVTAQYGMNFSIFDLVETKYDKEKAKALLEKHLEELGQMPENWAAFLVYKSNRQNDYFGLIDIGRIKHSVPAGKKGIIASVREYFGKKETEEDANKKAMEKRQQTKAKLIEVLSKHDGSCLSYEAQRIMEQVGTLTCDGPNRIGPVADVVLDRNWHEKLFSLDP